MKIQNGIMDTLASHGDHQLGGADWDRIIVDYALKQIGTSYDKLTQREQGMMMLAAEETKKTLTSQDKANLSFSYKGIQNVEITREDFEDLTADLIERTMMLVDETMEMAGVTPQQIDEVLLVGGSTFMPMVKAAVTEKMGKNPKMADPNLAVAKGAALTALQSEQGYIGTGITLGKDKGSRAYGMDCFIPEYNRVMILNIIMRNDDLEIHRVEEGITTRENNQTGVAFRFYENESTEKYLDVDDSLELEGKGGKIEWGRPVPAGTPIDIVVDRDKSGRVRVFAECMGAKGEFELVTPGAEGLSLNK
jgi:molecular chaperone DnaK (HSP70)